ncbi:MAG: DJ-1/PfpI family protein [Methanosarcinales archaeon]|nr:DJ-1/PfpI family protein [Methanosarcinales archaeon]
MKVVVPMAEGFEEIEFVTIVDLLRRAGIQVVTAALKEGPVEGSHGIRMMADLSLDQVDPRNFDALALPGGYPGFVNLGRDQRVVRLVQEMDRAGKYVTAICGAPSVLISAGVVEGRKATINPAGRDQLSADQYRSDRVVVDGKMITSQAVGTAMEFALKLVEVFAGEEASKKLRAEILASC